MSRFIRSFFADHQLPSVWHIRGLVGSGDPHVRDDGREGEWAAVMRGRAGVKLFVCEMACCCTVQPPFDGDTDDELFDNILRKQVHLPRSLGEDAKSIICGVGGA